MSKIEKGKEGDKSKFRPLFNKGPKSQVGLAETDFLTEHITYRFYRHPVTMVLQIVQGGLALTPFWLLIIFLAPILSSSREELFLWAVLIMSAIFVVLMAYIHWRMNLCTLNDKTFIIHQFTGIQRHSHEAIDVGRINTFDIRKEGFMPYFFDIADIELATIISVDENSTSLTIPNMWHAEKTVEIIKRICFNVHNSKSSNEPR